MEDKYKVTASQSLAGKMPNKADTKVIDIDDNMPPEPTPSGNISPSSGSNGKPLTTYTYKYIMYLLPIKCNIPTNYTYICMYIGENEKPSPSYAELFEKFCSSSTIHGTYFWYASGSGTSRVIWGFIVLFGIFLSAVLINNSFEEWKKHPIMTNVRQAPVEEINMPSLTICSLDDNR